MKTYKILILEDDFEAVSKIMAELYNLEGHFSPMDFDVTVLSTYEAVEKLINPQEADAYDVILLDRDCKMAGSFHILDMEKFGVHKIISISSTPQWNEEAKARGVKRIVPKSFSDLDGFARNVAREIKYLLKRKDNNTDQEPNLVSFLNGSGPDNSGRYIDQVIEMEDVELEDIHDYIQWLFPLTEPSNAVPNSPILTQEEISLIKEDDSIKDNLFKAKERMEQFYANNNHWIDEYDHNHLRISRIIKSLNLLLDREIAERFYNKIIDRVNNSENDVSGESILNWKEALNK
jgi:hypothetical protein